MIKKLVAALIVFTFVMPITGAQAATIKPGAKCTKLKATTTVAGIKYTCIKSGGKSIWSKGVKVSSDLKAGVCPNATSVDAKTGVSKQRANTLIGMSESKARKCADTLKWVFRIIEQDGDFFAITQDFLLDRVNVTINNGIIVLVSVG